ncbi:MAG: glycosyltransferase family 2 protein [Synechocystis sp.]
MENLGIVVIGRNEGDRLKTCLQSVVGAGPVVYVDSGSTDISVELAESLGVGVVRLDLGQPFTAARARNAGFTQLLAMQPQIKYVQFVDGDCEVVTGWLETAYQFLERNAAIAVVCGRRRERYPERSIYNRLCDLEWDTPVGQTKACGGDALMRVEAFQAVGGFNDGLIAGEEPELCVRLRQQQWQIWRLEAEMTWHDAQMLHWSQWWKRHVRAGFAFAEGAWLHGQPPKKHWVKESRSIWLWALIIPVVSLGASWPTSGLSLILLLGYPLILYKTARYFQQQGLSAPLAWLYAGSCLLAKAPQLVGQLRFHWLRWTKQQATIVEYKDQG